MTVHIKSNQRYGWLCVKPSWLQPLNNIKTFLVVLFVARALYVGTGDGAVGVVVSTLEKRFDLSSSQSSWLASIVDISSMIAVIFFTLLGTKCHRPRVLAFAILSLGIASFLFVIPHIVSPLYEPPTNDDKTLCSGNFSSPCDSDEDKTSSFSAQASLATLLSARFLVGAGYPAVGIQGFTYLDDAVGPGTYAFYAAIMDISTLAGTTFTYATGSSMLKLHTYFYNPTLVPERIEPGDSGWIGAWWLLFTLVGLVCLPVAAVIAGYPKSSYGLGTPEDQKLKAKQNKRDANTQNNDIRFYQRPFLRNIVFWNTQFYRLCAILIIFGIAAYSPKYMEIQFNLSPTMAGISLGGVLVFSGTLGSLAGGAVIPRWKLKCKGILKMMAFGNIPFFACFGVFFLACGSSAMQGSPTEYHPNSENAIDNTTYSWCSSQCGCMDIPYSPVCGSDGIQYFSPCHAGCLDVNGWTYNNCSCILEATEGKSSGATFGSCPESTCYALPVFLVLIAIGFTFACGALAMQNAAVLRCVSKSDRNGALGFNTLQACLGGIAGPIILGWAFDDSCSVWDYPCGERGVCLAYNKSILSRNIVLLFATTTSVCVITCFVAWKLFKPRDGEEEDEEIQGTEISNSQIFKLKSRESLNGVDKKLKTNAQNGHATHFDPHLKNYSRVENGDAAHTQLLNGHAADICDRNDTEATIETEPSTKLMNGHALV